MSRSEPTRSTTSWVFSTGLLLIGFWLLSWWFSDEMTLAAKVALGGGAVALVVSVVLNAREVASFLHAYWIVFAMVASVAIGLFLPESWVESVRPAERVPPWGVRVLIALVLLGASAGIRAKTRIAESFLHARAAVAANVTLMIILAVAALVAVNMLGSSVADLGSYDTTEMRVYSLTDRTNKILDELPGTVYATYLQFGSTYRPVGGREPLGDRGIDFLKQYSDRSTNVVMKVLSPVRDKADAEDYLRSIGVTKLEFGGEDTVLFTYSPEGADEPNREDVAVSTFTFLERSRLGTRKFKGEQLYTKAILNVVHEKRKVYVLKGHGEMPLYGGRGPALAEASEVIRKLALDVESLSIADEGKVPDDADLVIIAGPTAPLLTDEVDKLLAYLEKGGSLILAVEPQMDLRAPGTKPVKLGLEKYLADLGIEARTDHICVDYDVAVGTTGAGALMKTLTITTADYGDHTIVEDISARNFPCRFIEACPVMVEAKDAAKDDETGTTELLYVRRSEPAAGYMTYAAKLRPGRDPGARDDGDILDERMPLGVAAERKVGGEEEGRSTRVVVFGDSDFMSTMGLMEGGRSYAPGNRSLLANAVSWAVRRESLISIEPKTLESETVTLGQEEEDLAFDLVWAIPMIVLILAIGVAWIRRR